MYDPTNQSRQLSAFTGGLKWLTRRSSVMRPNRRVGDVQNPGDFALRRVPNKLLS